MAPSLKCPPSCATHSLIQFKPCLQMNRPRPKRQTETFWYMKASPAMAGSVLHRKRAWKVQGTNVSSAPISISVDAAFGILSTDTIWATSCWNVYSLRLL